MFSVFLGVEGKSGFGFGVVCEVHDEVGPVCEFGPNWLVGSVFGGGDIVGDSGEMGDGRDMGPNGDKDDVLVGDVEDDKAG